MHDFCYGSKREAAPIKAELIDLIHRVQDYVRDDFTFQYYFVGSSSRNMITYDRKSNVGFDFDVNIVVNDDDEQYSPKEIRTFIREAFNRFVREYGYDYCEDSTSVLTIKKKNVLQSKIIHSCDIAIVTIVMTAGNNTLDLTRTNRITHGNIEGVGLNFYLLKFHG